MDITCPACDGTKRYPPHSEYLCEFCNGKGTVTPDTLEWWDERERKRGDEPPRKPGHGG